MNAQNIVPLPTAELPEEAPQRSEPEAYRYVEALKALIQTKKQAGTPLTQAEIARRVGYSSSAISQYLGRKYDGGDLKKLDRVIGELIRLERAYQQYMPQVTEIAQTTQVIECMKAIEFIERHKSFGVIVGEAGIGKSKGFDLYAQQHRSSTLLLTMDWLKGSPFSFVQALWCKLPGKTRGNRTRLPKVSFLLDDIILHFREQPRTLLLDEAQFLSMAALEIARSLQDQTRIGIVLGGTFDLEKEIGFDGPIPTNAQLLSRVRMHRVLSATISEEDLTTVANLYGIADAELIAWLYQHCNKPGRRYRWVDAILHAAHDRCVEQQTVMSVQALRHAAKFTGLE